MKEKDYLEKIKDLKLKPEKRLGQNFLIDPDVIDLMVKLAWSLEGQPVLEVGPGLGFLTTKLIREAKRVVGVEIDKKLINNLKTQFGDKKNFRLIVQDILKVNLKTFFKNDFKVVASLPYQLTTPFLKKIVSLDNRPKKMVLLLQREVGQRLSAGPGQSNRGMMSVLVQLFYQIKLARIVKPKSFYPSPKVDSAVVVFDLKNNQPMGDINDGKLDQLADLLGAGFRHKRKKVINSLANCQDCKSKEELIRIFKLIGLNSNLRAEDLSEDDWLALLENGLILE